MTKEYKQDRKSVLVMEELSLEEMRKNPIKYLATASTIFHVYYIKKDLINSIYNIAKHLCEEKKEVDFVSVCDLYEALLIPIYPISKRFLRYSKEAMNKIITGLYKNLEIFYKYLESKSR